MKRILPVIVACLLVCHGYSQSPDTSILIIPCQPGTLVIDGVEKGVLTADDAHPEKISFGDHYLQLKTPAKKYNLTLRIDRNLSSNIVRLGCEEKLTGTIKLMEKKMTIVGLISPQTEKNTFGLDAGDELLITCSVLNKNGTVNISVTRQDNGAEIYRKESFNALDHERVPISQKGIYVVALSTNALLGRDANLVLERLPSKSGDANFKTGVGYVYDTSFVEVMSTTSRVFSTLSGHSNRTIVKVNLPAETSYWTFWIGVGQQSREQFKKFVTDLSGVGKLVSSNPLVLYGMKLIPDLPILNMTSTVSYRFTNTQNAQLFSGGQAARFYDFKYAGNISADYALINQANTDLTLCLENSSTMVGQDVDIKVVAFIIKKRLAIDK